MKDQQSQFPKIINGCWQLSSGHNSHGNLNKELIKKLIMKYIDASFYVFDCADIYQGVEEILGDIRRIALREGKPMRIHTKYVPNLDQLEQLAEKDIQHVIERSCTRMKCEALDLVQFHWWDYQSGDYIKTLKVLNKLKINGLIKNLGLTNFNTEKLREILGLGISISSIQIQYSLIDSRADKKLLALCKEKGIKVFTYGTLSGGFISEKWIDVLEPKLEQIENRSLVKYKAIIDQAGGWGKFQNLLKVLERIAIKHNTSIYNIVLSYMINHTPIDSAILGVSYRFLDKNVDISYNINLDKTDLETIDQIKMEFYLPGDVYDLERERSGPHGKIMKYNLS